MNINENIELTGHYNWQSYATNSNCYTADPVQEYEFSSHCFNLDNISYSKSDHQNSNCLNSKQSKLNKIPRKFVRSRPLSEEELDRKRITANIQERRRMQRLNTALDRLKRSIPQHLHVHTRRLSKIKTLKLAIDYIAFLNDSLHQDSSQFADATLSNAASPHNHLHSEHTSVDQEMVSSSSRNFNANYNFDHVSTSNIVLSATEDHTASFECDATNNQLELTINTMSPCSKVVQTKDQYSYAVLSSELD